MAAAPRSLCLLVNDRGAADERLRAAVHALRDDGHRIEVRLLWEPGQAEQFAREAAERDAFDAIVAGGGDGTLNEVVNGVMEARPDDPPSVGLLPYGTANDFALTAGIPANDPAAALRIALEAEPRRLDLGRVHGRWFINAATAGLNAEITADTPASLKHLLGGAAYSLNALAKLADDTPRPVRLTGPPPAPGEVDAPAAPREPPPDARGLAWEGDLLMLIVANARTAGGGFPIAADAKLDDGLLDVTIVPHAPARDLTAALAHLVTRGRPDHPAIIQCRVPWLEIESEQPLPLNLDGEQVTAQGCRIEIHPRALPVLMGS